MLFFGTGRIVARQPAGMPEVKTRHDALRDNWKIRALLSDIGLRYVATLSLLGSIFLRLIIFLLAGFSVAAGMSAHSVRFGPEAGWIEEAMEIAVASCHIEPFVHAVAGNGTGSDQPHSHTKNGQTTTYTYDASGNRAGKSVGGVLKESYGWDSRNRLVSLTQASPAKTYSYGYDYRASRVIRNESAAAGENTTISFSGGTSAFEKVGSTLKVEYVRGSDYGGRIGGIMYTVRSGVNSFNAYNIRRDVVAKTTSAGTVSWQATYESFGTRTTETGTNPDRQKANTKEEDPTGLLNEGFRYRDLVTGLSLILKDWLRMIRTESSARITIESL